jgi:inosine-uridine nucleoside N-ribohydrolase
MKVYSISLFILLFLISFTLVPFNVYGGSMPPALKKIPVILDTDIGDDIDDTWALVMLLKSPEFDIKMVIGDNHNGIYRAKIIARMLEIAGRTDIPIGMAYSKRQDGGNQSDWVKDYDLESYPGKIHEDGVGAMIDIITKSEEKITVIAIGPVPNLAEALRREPGIAENASFVGMHGSVYLGYDGSEEISAEYNVKMDVKACQKVFAAPWDMVITPLDTCGLVHLRNNKYARVRDSNDPLAKALVENYRIWLAKNKNEPVRTDEKASSTLFDTVAIYLAFSDELCKMETLGIVVDDKGFTRIKKGAKKMKVATKWKDMGKFEDLLVERIIGPVVKPQ